jgi:hypothetical protein
MMVLVLPVVVSHITIAVTRSSFPLRSKLPGVAGITGELDVRFWPKADVIHCLRFVKEL